MRVILSVVLGIAVFFLMLAADAAMHREEEKEDGTKRTPKTSTIILAAVFGLLAGLINGFVPLFYGALGVLAPIALIVMITMTLYLGYWWWSERTVRGLALLPLIAIVVIFYFITMAAAILTANMVLPSVFAASLIMFLPNGILVGMIGFILSYWLFNRYKDVKEQSKEQKGGLPYLVLAIIVAALAVLAIIILLVAQVQWSSMGQVGNQTGLSQTGAGQTSTGQAVVSQTGVGQAGTGQTAGVAATGGAGFASTLIPTAVGNITFPGTAGFYNAMLQNDGIEGNEFNFGPNPIQSGLMAVDYDRDLRQRMAYDPALTAGALAWYDANAGTRFLGSFYDSCKGKWAEAINQARDSFIADPNLWLTTLVRFYQMLDETATVSLTEASGLKDQMYMNPYTVNGMSDVIVMTTDQPTGTFLTYGISIKGNLVQVSYRIECGYQPTNVEEVMGIAPQPQPEPQPQPQPQPEPQPEPVPTPTPVPTPQPEPQPEPVPQKDPTQSPTVNTQPNDDPTAGPATNNGVGATTSTADQPTNSTSYETPQEYAAAVEELADINANQATGADDNTPTITPPPSTTVDNNGDSGSVNSPTTVAPPVAVAGDSESAGMIGTPD